MPCFLGEYDQQEGLPLQSTTPRPHLMSSSMCSMYLSKHGFRAAASCGRLVCSHVATAGAQPSSESDTWMMPARDIVAGQT